jgi:hypothetical protein
MKTKRWTKPKLVVLCKGRPEESVLTVCKRTGQTLPFYANCQQNANHRCQTQSKS